MKDLPRVTLKGLVGRYGISIASDPVRCEGLLRDTCGSCGREIFVLINAAKQKIPADLLSPRQTLPFPLMKGFLVKRLQDELAFSDEAAHWAVEAWASALNLSDEGEAGRYEDRKKGIVPLQLGPDDDKYSPVPRVGSLQMDQWTDDLTDPLPARRLAAVQGLSRTGGTAAVWILIGALDNSQFPVRETVFDVLASGDPVTIPLLIEALMNSSDGIVWRVAILLGALRSREAIEPLSQLLSREGKVRLSAIWALGEIGSEDASTPLLKYINHPDPLVIQETVEALKKIGRK